MKRSALIAIVVALAGVACSNGSTPKADATASEGLAGLEACVTTPSPIAQPSFPSGFPEMSDVTWTLAQNAGPTQVISGYTGDDFRDVYNEVKEKFGEAHVTKSELDPHDAEVNFAIPKFTGQVSLAQECQGRTSVRVTVRPA